MKKTIILSLLFAANFCFAQPQWKFHIAFEDATGAKDTIWLIWDTTATGGVQGTGYDTLLGEGPFNFDYSIFNVWTHNENGDSTKTSAFPYTAKSFLPYVYAFNYLYPITIRWDSSLFHAPYLPIPVGYINRAIIDNDYFFFVNNNSIYHTYNMLIDNSVIAPEFFWGSQSQFPMIFYVAKDPSLNIEEFFFKSIKLFPNPVTDHLTIESENKISKIELLSIEGKVLDEWNIVSSTEATLQLNIDPGIYILKIITAEYIIYYNKIFKM